MASNRPAWVIKDLTTILGLDADSVNQLLLPEFEAYPNATRLKGHLQDFLGFSAAARAFTDRYVELRFPSLMPAASAMPPPSLPSGPTKPTIQKQKSGTSSRSGPSKEVSMSDAISAAFGPGGKIYQKSTGGKASSGGSGPASASGSGSHTPMHASHSQRGHMRQAGAMTIHEAKPANNKGSESNKGKEREKIWDHPKSKEVKRLEGIVAQLKDVQAGEGKVKIDASVPPCYCQARNHPLSTYTPHCPHCGLILCELHPVHAPCASCQKPLLSPAGISRLILRIQSDVDAQLGREQAARDDEERQRAAEVAAQAAFPYLSSAGGKASAQAPSPSPQDLGRKVLTIGGGKGGKGKGKATLTTTYMRPALPSSGGSTSSNLAAAESQTPTDVVPRPRSPPLERARIEKEIAKVLQWRTAEDRPWGDPKAEKRGEGWKYAPLPASALMLDDDHVGRRKAKKKIKGLGVDGKAVVGAAAVAV